MPSLLVSDTRHILFLKTTLPDGTSRSLPEAVVEDVVDILNFVQLLLLL